VATTFSRTTRALRADGFRRWVVGLGVIGVLLVAWGTWFIGARDARVEVSQTARVEVEEAARAVESTVDGRIVVSHLELGRAVALGDVMLELDAKPQELEQNEARARLDALGPETARLRDEIAAQEAALAEAARAGEAALTQARAHRREAEAASRSARQDADRLEQLHASGIVAESEYRHARSEAEQRVAATDALESAVGRTVGEQQAQDSERRAQIGGLERELAKLEGESRTLAATIERLGNEIERRKIHAVIAGTLADVAPVQVGSVVQPGQRLGTIVPASAPTLKMVAQFRPSEALGRVHVGQPARVRLEGFPWMQYGSVAATVTQVAGEIRDGLVRVDLALAPERSSAIPLQHGLPGVVEIEIERVSPMVLALRAAGQFLTRAAASGNDVTSAS